MCRREAQSPESALSSYISSTTARDQNAAFLFIWLHRVLVAAFKMFSCGMWDLVPWPRIEPGPPALQVCISAWMLHFNFQNRLQRGSTLSCSLLLWMLMLYPLSGIPLSSFSHIHPELLIILQDAGHLLNWAFLPLFSPDIQYINLLLCHYIIMPILWMPC